jgi:hypothetical protein
MMSDEFRRRRLPVAASLAAIGLATLTPRPDQADLVARTPPWCIVCGELGAVDVLLNIALFFPLGAALRLRGYGAGRIAAGRIAALTLVVSIAVELMQVAIPGRDPTLSDVLTNTIGGIIGGMVAGWSHHLTAPRSRTAGLLAAAWAALWLVQTAATAALIQPSLPRSWYWGQLAPDLEQFEQFEGRVLFAAAGPHRIHIGRLPASAEIREALLAGETLRATTTPGEWTSGLAPIVSIFDGQQREIVLLGRWGDDLAYRLRTRAFDFRLRPPAIRLAGAFVRSDTLVGVVGRFDPSAGHFAVTLRSASGSAARVVPLDAQWGWSLLLPFSYAHGAESRWFTAFWVGAWMLPLGYWSVAYRRLAVGGAAVVLAFGLLLLPLASRLTPTGAAGWLAGVAGLGLGVLLSSRRVRAAPPPHRKA